MRIIKVVFGISDIKERTPLTEGILGDIVCVIPYVEIHILKVRLLIIVAQVDPWHIIFKVIEHEDCMYKRCNLKINDELQLAAISCDAILISDIARIVSCFCTVPFWPSAGIPVVTGTAALLVVYEILSSVIIVYWCSRVVDSGEIH